MLLYSGSFVVLAFLAFFSVCTALRKAKNEEFPFQVSIQNMNKNHICGGAIIAPNWILTASECLRSEAYVRVNYGSVDSNNPLASINSQIIVHQGEFDLLKRNRLALIKLQSSIQYTKTVKQAKLPTLKAELRNTTKLCEWKTQEEVDVYPCLYVKDNYDVIPKNCRTTTGVPVILNNDEFCGMNEQSQSVLYNPGTIVSKAGIVLGIMTERVVSQTRPYIFVMISENNQWIKNTLKDDAEFIEWVDEVPKDSAISNHAVSLALTGISVILLYFI